jgi:hypothetical protein
MAREEAQLHEPPAEIGGQIDASQDRFLVHRQIGDRPFAASLSFETQLHFHFQYRTCRTPA